MSYGDRENGRDQQTSSKISRPSSHGDEFGLAVAKIAVGQICRSAGFHGSHRSAIDALTRVAVRYTCELGKSANFYANLSGRTSCNVLDIIQAIEDLSSTMGFSGASDVHHCLVSSGVVREITRFVTTAEEVPFGQPIPKFPIPRGVLKSTISFAQTGETSGEKHIPDWLPRLPDPSTYVHTPVLDKSTTDTQPYKLEQARQRRKTGRSFLRLQGQLDCNNSAGYQPISVNFIVGKGKQVVGSNPFLAPPFSYGEKVVSEVPSPWEGDAGKRLSVLESSTPVTEAANVGSIGFTSDEKTVLPMSRPTVHFKLRVERKSVAASFSLEDLDNKNDNWFLTDDDKDDKKRRAEVILKETMQKTHDLPPL